MASSSTSNNESGNTREDRKKQVMLGDLPPDFLRVMPASEQQQLAVDEQAAVALQQQLTGCISPIATGRLSITIAEAKLNKNYGMTRMDPYVRLRIGHSVYETYTDHNGAKNPSWNKTFHCFLFPNVRSLFIEIFDECAFTLDEKIAWANYPIPDQVFQGESVDEWIALSGRLGDGKEGFINLILSYVTMPYGTAAVVYPNQPLVTVVPGSYYVAPGVPYVPTAVVPASQPSQPAPQPYRCQPPTPISDADVQQVKEMFPDLETDIIKAVMESHNGNKDQTINALLNMSEGS